MHFTDKLSIESSQPKLATAHSRYKDARINTLFATCLSLG